LCFIANTISAQQNIFNIPSVEATEAKRFFYQHQLNLYTDKVESKGHLVYGLGKGIDIGLNVVGKGLLFEPSVKLSHNDNPKKGPLSPVVMGVFQKIFKVNKRIKIAAGLQSGFNLSNEFENKEHSYWSYGLLSYEISNDIRVLAGGYYTNVMYVGNANVAGLKCGYEWRINKRLYLIGDWISGQNDAAVAVIGGMYNISKRIQLCSGVQIPNFGSNKDMALVLEINILGWDLY
jgi:hypothetical protein